MTMKSCSFYCLLTLLFLSLTSCGSSDSKSSGERQKDSSGTVKACAIGTNNLKEGQSCKIDSGKYADTYTCKSGKVVYSTGETTKGGSWMNTDPTKLIVIICR